MSKYCPIAKAYTNCTDNCHSCMEENTMERLIEKVRQEQREYLDRIEQLPPRDIIGKAYEICYREELVGIIENTVYDDETIELFLNTPYLIDVLYDEWLKTDTSICSMLEDVITDFVYESSNR